MPVVSPTSSSVSNIISATQSSGQSLVQAAQKAVSGLQSSILPTKQSTSAAPVGGGVSSAAKDTRIRLSPLPQAASQVYGANGSNILTPLYSTNGLLFPYSPSITFSQQVSYQDVSMVHSNMDYAAYQKTPSVSLTLSGKFTVQTQEEGIYTLACIHFLRVVSKMYFGENYNGGANTYMGLPPPVLLLNGYGTYMFNNLRVILKSHTYNYTEQMDTVLVSTANGTARLPALFDLSMELQVQQTPRAMRKDFDLGKFRTGALMLTGGGWV